MANRTTNQLTEATNVLTGDYYMINRSGIDFKVSAINAANNLVISGGFLTAAQTGVLTGVFYSISNPSNFIVPAQTGAFYPKVGNPSGFVLQSGISPIIVNLTGISDNSLITKTGIALINTTPADSSHSQNSPGLYWVSQYWNGAKSTPVVFRSFVYGGAGRWQLQYSLDTGVSWTTPMYFDSNLNYFNIVSAFGVQGNATFNAVFEATDSVIFDALAAPGINKNLLAIDFNGNVSSIFSGMLVTTGQTGVFYLKNNPSGFIVPSQTGGFLDAGKTGVLSNVFYPLISNPSGFIVNKASFPNTGTTMVIQVNNSVEQLNAAWTATANQTINISGVPPTGKSLNLKIVCDSTSRQIILNSGFLHPEGTGGLIFNIKANKFVFLNFVSDGSGFIENDNRELRGVIKPWYGNSGSIPDAWTLCNGTLGTPDLRNRFIIGANADSAGVAKSTIEGAPTQAGGLSTSSTTVDLTSNQVSVASGPDFSVPLATIYNSASFSVVPPYFALYYIMKL